MIFSRSVFRTRIFIYRNVAGGVLESIVLCFIYSSKESRKRYLTWHTEKETCLVGFLSPSHKESVESEPVALDRKAAVSLGERSSSSARQAGRHPRADQENPCSLTCYRGALKGLRTAGFFWLLRAVNTQIVADDSRSIPLQ